MYADPFLHEASATTLKRLVTALVTATLDDASESRARLVARLRRVESAAWTAGCDPQTLQVIISGRRLLDDLTDLTPEASRRTTTRRWTARQCPDLWPWPEGSGFADPGCG